MFERWKASSLGADVSIKWLEYSKRRIQVKLDMSMKTSVLAVSCSTLYIASAIESRINNPVVSGMKAVMIGALRDKMKNGIAHFVYKKKDGSYREAFGTLNRDLIDNYINNSGESRYKYQCMVYFDVQVGWFRSFRWENIVSVL